MSSLFSISLPRLAVRVRLCVLALLLVLGIPAWCQSVPEPPSPPRLVNDLSGKLLSAAETEQLEAKLLDFNRKTGQQLAIVVVPDMGGYEVEEYANALFNKWGIGGRDGAGKDNGILLLVGLAERRLRIETGYGNEGPLTDVVAGRIIENDLKPNFRAEQYYAAFDQATTSIMAQVAPDYKPITGQQAQPRQKARQYKREGKSMGIGQMILTLIIGVIVIWALIKNPWLLLLFMNSGGRRGGGGGWSDFSGGSGGFGGFGGGRSGGGGASGSW